MDLAGNGEGTSLAEQGRQIFENACFTCHTTDGESLVGPSFKGLWMSEREIQEGEMVTADENYIRESILSPNEKIASGYHPGMPSYAGALSDRQIEAIIEYIKSLE